MHRWLATVALLGLVLLCGPVSAHFQVLIPSRDIVDGNTGPGIELDLVFTHPMAGGPAMDMGPPASFGVLGPVGREDSTQRLQRRTVDRKGAFRATYRFRQPGDYAFYLEPAPYWEPGERVMIIHYTKVVVDAFGAQSGWDADVGFPVEIEPLTRPYGLWAGNLFQGVVKRGGRPVPFAEVEVEWLNDGSVTAPSDPYLTQVVRADANGTFAYAVPRAGWWGFAAVLEGDEPMVSPGGDEVPVELGAVVWVHARDMD